MWHQVSQNGVRYGPQLEVIEVEMGLYLFQDVRKGLAIKRLDIILLPFTKFLRIFALGVEGRDDGYCSLRCWCPPERDLCGESRAKSASTWVGKAGQPFKYGALATKMIIKAEPN